MSDNEQKNETVDDVLAEMLERADAMQTHGTTHGVRLAIREFARRIKAAWARDRTEVEDDALAVGGIVEAARHKPVSNAAAMREALLNIQEYAAAMNVDDGNVLAILDACRDALAAPVRNCDRFRTKDDERTYFDNIVCQRSNGSGSMECKGCPLDRIDNPHRADYREEWLFATASERKGEDDGR